MKPDRRSALAVLGVATVSGLFARPVNAQEAADLSGREGNDWPGFLGPTGDSVLPGPELPVWGKGGPPVVWDLELGEGYAPPSVWRGRVYIYDRAGKESRLRALELKTGKPLWSFSHAADYVDSYGYDGGPRTSPVIADGRVFSYSAEGCLHALDAVSGKLLWKRSLNQEFGVVQNFFGVGSTPVAHGKRLLVQVGGSPPGSDPTDFPGLKANGSGVVALDQATGETVWKAGDDLASYAGPVVARLGEADRVLMFGRSGLWSLRADTGAVDFHHPYRAKNLESVNASNPVVLPGGHVLITETYGPGGTLLKWGKDKPEVVWTDADKGRNKSAQGHWNTPVVAGDHVYLSSGRHESNAELRAVEWRTGKVAWSEPGLGRCSILRVANKLIIQAERGPLLVARVNPAKLDVERAFLLENKEGAPLLRAPCWAAPVLARGYLLVRGAGRLVCLDALAG
jgi:outer membrane protein assembly factor BamB